MASADILTRIVQAARALGIDPALALAVAHHESGGTFNNALRGGSGEYGMFQIMPFWQRIAQSKGWDIRTTEGNIMMGTYILAEALRAERGNPTNAFRRYNGGPAWSRKPVTATYAEKVNALAAKYKARLSGDVAATSGYAYPVPNGKVISVWGDPRDGGARKHEGIDIAAPKGSPIVSFVGGTVTRVNTKDTGLGGRTVWVRGADGREYYYAHLDTIAVKVGQKVGIGSRLGTVGNTGNARTTPPHLHFGIYQNGKAVDPAPFLAKGVQGFTGDIPGGGGSKPRQTAQSFFGAPSDMPGGQVRNAADVMQERQAMQQMSGGDEVSARQDALARALSDGLGMEQGEARKAVAAFSDAIVSSIRNRVAIGRAEDEQEEFENQLFLQRALRRPRGARDPQLESTLATVAEIVGMPSGFEGGEM